MFFIKYILLGNRFPICIDISLTLTLTNQNGQRKHKVLFKNVILIHYLQNTLLEIQQPCTLQQIQFSLY